MSDFVKMIVVGRGREVIRDLYVRNGEAWFRRLGQFPTLLVTRDEDHHAKLHLHMQCGGDSRAVELAGALIRAHRTLRFTFYYETPEGSGMVVGRDGKVEKETFRRRDGT
jgi:hypothetical protein